MRKPFNEWWKAGDTQGCIGAFQPFGARTETDAVLNLADDQTVELTVVSNLQLTASGWRADGIGFVQTDLRPVEEHAVFVAFSGIVEGAGGAPTGGTLFDSASNAPRYSIHAIADEDLKLMNFDDEHTIPGIKASGVVAITPTNAWVDGSKVHTWIPAAASEPYWDFILMASMYPDTGDSNVPMFNGYLGAVAFYNPAPTDFQAEAIMTAMAALEPWGFGEEMRALLSQLYNQRQDWAVVKHTEDRYALAIYDAAHYAPELLWQRYYDTTLAGVDDQKSYTLPSPVTADNLRRVGIAGLQGYDFKGQWNAFEDAVQGDLIEFQAQPTVDAAIRLEYVLPPVYGKIDYIDRKWLVCEAMVRLLMEADPLMEPAEKIQNDLANWAGMREARYREMRKQQREYPARVNTQGVAQYGY